MILRGANNGRQIEVSESIDSEPDQSLAPPSETEQIRQAEEPIIRQFVDHWGKMARSWGINSSMGELFALLYVQGAEWTADALRQYLRVSRGNVSMNLRELMSWGLVHKVIHPGERREFFRAETDVWTLFQRILKERKKRELEPTLRLLETSLQMADTDQPDHQKRRDRIYDLKIFFDQIDSLASRMLTIKKEDIDDLQGMG